MLSIEQDLRELLSRRDPHGYYVIPLKPEGLELVSKYYRKPGVIVVEYGDITIIKTRSRSLAEKIARKLVLNDMLGDEEL